MNNKQDIMSELICPHCHNRVPRGARVCRGCQAELHYGAHPALYAIAVIIGFYLMHEAGAAVPHLPDVVKLGILVITGGGLCSFHYTQVCCSSSRAYVMPAAKSTTRC
ncbi:hypothetical protein, partial [Burkholderia ubonensis]|uniref:hypothetical protein n=1 Tax=Burkholderia ubonensis TaxID=101571 RepID=UPI001E3CDE0E